MNYKTLTITALSVALMMGCSLRKRSVETPPPSEQNIEKNFFFKGADTSQPKRFLFGAAPIESDANGEYMETYLAQDDLHVNVEFEITEKSLIGLEVNPSYPNNRKKWNKVLEIPITKHYYYEARRDEYGRETKDVIENDQRSHWSERPYIKLDLTGVKINVDRVTYSGFSVKTETLAVDGIEWNHADGFLGFNMNQEVSFSFGQSNSIIANIKKRFNLLAFDSNKNFQATPFHVDSAKFFNILHVVSRQIEEGHSRDKQVMKAAKWDFSKPLDVYLDNVPNKYVQLFKDAFNEWSRVLEKIGAVPAGQKAFNVRTDYPSKYPFDLRYPAVHWVDDKRISASSPLGIALNNADVETGQMLSANVIMYGGMLESLLNRYSSVGNSAASQLQLANSALFPDYKLMAFNFSDLLQENSGFIAQKLNQDIVTRLQETLQVMKQNGDDVQKETYDELYSQFQKFSTDTGFMNKVIKDMATMNLEATPNNQSLQEMDQYVENYVQQTPMHELFGFNFLKNESEKDLRALLLDQHAQDLKQKQNLWGNGSIIYHHDRTFAHVAPMWASAMERIESSSKREEAMRAVIKNVLLHELGHFLGLGHQFKGTIVPEAGTMPSQYTNDPKNLKDENSLLSRSLPKNGSTNYTSIMDYANGRVEVAIPESHVLVGAHDELVLRYIYNGEVTVFNKQEDKFEYIPLSQFNEQNRGYIPNEINGMKVSYFPACNDYDASLLKDPECNRWDMGTRPVDIVKSYTANIDDNISNILFNFTDSSERGAWDAEGRLWYTSLDTFSHLRTFYDRLRIKLNSTPIDPKNPNSVSMWERLRTDEDALFDFSKACKSKNNDSIRNTTLQQIMADKEVKELCLANLEVLETMKKYVSLPLIDYTRKDQERYMHGGYIAGEGSKFWGKYISGDWYALTNYPLKVISLYALSSSNPFMLWGPYLMSNVFYDYAGNRFLYRTLFPNEVTDIMSTTVNKNLSFATSSDNNLGAENKTLLGSSVLALSYFNSMMNYGPFAGNEISRLPENYVNILQDQTNFDFSIAAIIIKAVDPTSTTGDPNLYKKFTVEVFDFGSHRTSKLQDFYILPNARIIARNNNMFLYPLTKIRFFSDKEAYVISYKIGYDEQREDDPLLDKSVKTHLTNLHTRIVNDCIIGANDSGLSSYFSGGEDSNFAGFEILPGISTEQNNTKKYRFEESIEEEFQKYEAYAKQKNAALNTTMTYKCNEAVRGVGLISSVAALLNGYWLGVTNNYVER